MKDNVDVTGEVTAHGAAGTPTPAGADSEVVRRLRGAGAVILGKTALCELAAWGHFTSSPTHGVTRNPWNLDRSPGGSSGGSAAAVAAGLVPIALGSDGGGSIRIPSAFCGLFGLKLQRGRVPLGPLDDHWYGCTVLGGLGRSVLDVAIFNDVDQRRAGRPEPERSLAAAAGRDPDRLRIAVLAETGDPGRQAVARSRLRAIEQTAELLRSLGHEVSETKLAHPQLLVTFTPRWAAGIGDDADSTADGLERRTRRMAAVGRRLRRPGAAAQHRARAGVAGRLNAVFDDARPGDDPDHRRSAADRGDLTGRGRVSHVQPGQPVRLLHADLELRRAARCFGPGRFRPRRPPPGGPARRPAEQ